MISLNGRQVPKNRSSLAPTQAGRERLNACLRVMCLEKATTTTIDNGDAGSAADGVVGVVAAAVVVVVRSRCRPSRFMRSKEGDRREGGEEMLSLRTPHISDRW